jgi:acetylglutamate kinase
MRLVVKIAGALLEGEEDVQTLARQIAELARAGHELLVVHGGGKIFTATLARMGITSRFISGLRVTDRETRDAAVMVFAGLLNKKLAGAISLAGQPAVGICASDAACFLAEPMQVEDCEGGMGFVGYLTEVNVDFLRSLWREGIVPVASCMGLGADGELYNINADHMAAAAAEFIHADRLIFLTDVAGVMDGEKVLSALRGTDIEDLIRQHKVSGGMILKLEAAKRALAGGVSEVRIVGGTKPRALLAAAGGGRCPGTRVLPVIRTATKAAHGTPHGAAHGAAQ